MKFYITERSVRYKGKTYVKGACIEASTEEEKEILKGLVRQGYASENIVNIGGATEIISREREDLNEKKQELKKMETSLNLRDKQLNEKEERLNKFEDSLLKREKDFIAKEKEYKETKTGSNSNVPNEKSEEVTNIKDENNEIGDLKEEINEEIYKKLSKKEKTIYEALSDEERGTVRMFESYEDVKAYLASIEGR